MSLKDLVGQGHIIVDNDINCADLKTGFNELVKFEFGCFYSKITDPKVNGMGINEE